MKKSTSTRQGCFICSKVLPNQDLVSGELVCKEVVHEIKLSYPKWRPEYFICHADLALMRARYVHSLLLSEKGELTSLEQLVLNSVNEQELLSATLEAESEQKWTIGERLADKLASFGGSWRFLICFALFLTVWIGANSFVFLSKPADPYPFIFLNLILSCIAAIQAPVIMMSQNRLEARDRDRSQNDYQINLKAELEIRNLHEKMDHLLIQQWEKMVKIQQIQLEILTELTHKKY